MMARSLKMSARKRYALHSGSSEADIREANTIVARRPKEDCRIERRRAAVGVVCVEPTPIPIRTLKVPCNQTVISRSACAIQGC